MSKKDKFKVNVNFVNFRKSYKSWILFKTYKINCFRKKSNAQPLFKRLFQIHLKGKECAEIKKGLDAINKVILKIIGQIYFFSNLGESNHSKDLRRFAEIASKNGQFDFEGIQQWANHFGPRKVQIWFEIDELSASNVLDQFFAQHVKYFLNI